MARKPKKFTQKEKDIYRLGFLDGERKSNKGRLCRIIAEQSELLKQLDIEHPIRHVKINTRWVPAIINALRIGAKHPFIAGVLQAQLTKAEKAIKVSDLKIAEFLSKEKTKE